MLPPFSSQAAWFSASVPSCSRIHVTLALLCHQRLKISRSFQPCVIAGSVIARARGPQGASDLSFRGTDRCSVSAVHSVTVRSADSVAATQQERGGKCQEDRESGRHSRAAMRYATYDMLQVPISGVRKPSDANFRERRGSDEMARTASLHDE